jgi:hypothetical protein
VGVGDAGGEDRRKVEDGQNGANRGAGVADDRGYPEAQDRNEQQVGDRAGGGPKGGCGWRAGWASTYCDGRQTSPRPGAHRPAGVVGVEIPRPTQRDLAESGQAHRLVVRGGARRTVGVVWVSGQVDERVHLGGLDGARAWPGPLSGWTALAPPDPIPPPSGPSATRWSAGSRVGSRQRPFGNGIRTLSAVITELTLEAQPSNVCRAANERTFGPAYVKQLTAGQRYPLKVHHASVCRR